LEDQQMVSSKKQRKLPGKTQSQTKPKGKTTGRRPGKISAAQASKAARGRAEASSGTVGSKQALLLIERLCRPAGASISELQKALGWLPHTVRAAITGLRHKGFEVTRSRNDEGESVYRAPPPVTKVSA
jgi:hypothetical protein